MVEFYVFLSVVGRGRLNYGSGNTLRTVSVLGWVVECSC